MKLPQFFDTKQPLSLKWKWGILLLASFLVVSLLGVTIYHQQTMASRYEHLRSFSQQRFNIIENMLSGLDEPFQKIDFEENSLTGNETINDYLSYLENEDIVVRVYNVESQLIFETQRLTVPKTDSSRELTTVKVAGTETFVGNTPIFSKENEQLLGSLQFLVSPEVIRNMENIQNSHFFYLLAFLSK